MSPSAGVHFKFLYQVQLIRMSNPTTPRVGLVSRPRVGSTSRVGSLSDVGSDSTFTPDVGSLSNVGSLSRNIVGSLSVSDRIQH